MTEAKNEKFIVRVIRKRVDKEPGVENGVKTPRQESVDQIYEQEFDAFDVGKFATDLNKKTGTEKDEKSLKMAEDNKKPADSGAKVV
jgi:hypothetical protein